MSKPKQEPTESPQALPEGSGLRICVREGGRYIDGRKAPSSDEEEAEKTREVSDADS